MSDIKSELANLKLSDDDRLLLEEGIVDTCGVISQTGKDILWGYILEANKAELVKSIKIARTNRSKVEKAAK